MPGSAATPSRPRPSDRAALMVAAIILFMGTVSGAHLNPAVGAAFALRGDFPWKRVPAYIVAQFAGAVLATLLLWALIGKQGSAGLTLPGSGISTITAMVLEAVLTAGLVSVILGTASGAQRSGRSPLSASAAISCWPGLWGAPVSGASMNPARSLGPALVLNDWTGWWAYLAGRAYRRRHRGRHRLCAARTRRKASAGPRPRRARSAPAGGRGPSGGPGPIGCSPAEPGESAAPPGLFFSHMPGAPGDRVRSRR